LSYSSKILLFFASASLAFGQGSQLPKYTVATLPSASSFPTYTVQVIDGSTATDCTVGGGAYNVICTAHAGIWVPVGSEANYTLVPSSLSPTFTATSNTADAFLFTLNNNATASLAGASFGEILTFQICQNATGGYTFTWPSQMVNPPVVPTAPNACITQSFIYDNFDQADPTPYPTGITSLNSQTGPAVDLVGDSSITVTPGSPSANQIQLHATGTGGSGVQYNPSNTVHYFLSSSIMADDSHNTSVAVPVSIWSCNGTTCDIHTSSNHNLTTSSWVDLTSMTGWFSGNPLGGQQDTTYGSFQVASVVSATEFTVAYTRNTGSGSGGNIYDASYWTVYMTAQQPFFLGHGTMNYWWTPVQSAATNISTFLPTCTTTCFLNVEASQNDVFSGRTSAQIEGNFQTIWAAARAKGYKVIQGTVLPTNFGLSVTNQMWETIQEVNLWIRLQGPSQANKSSGQYWDELADVASYYSDGLTDKSTLPGNGTTGSKTFATQWNDAFGHQGGKLSVAPNAMPWESGLALSYPQNLFVLSNTTGVYNDAVVFDQTHDIWKYYQLYGSGGTTKPLFEYNWANAANGNHICNAWQINTTTNNSFALCLGYASSGSTSNYFSIAGGSGGTTDWIKIFANGAIQIPGITAASGVETLCVDTSGNIQHGTCGGASFSAIISGTNTAAAMLVGSGASLGPTGTGTIQATNIASTIAVTSPIAVTGSGTTASPYTIACPTCGTGSGGTSVSQNSGAAETNLSLTGFMPQVCSDSSGSGTAQTCTVANTFTPQAGNCIVYSTTTTNSGTGLTINVNSLGAKSVAIPGSSGFTTTLTASIIPANKPQLMCYDGTNWNDQQTGKVSAGGTVPNKTYLAFNSTPVTLPNSLTVYQSTTPIVLPANAQWKMNFALNRATAGTALSVSIGTGTSACYYRYALQADGNQVLYSVTSGGSQSLITASASGSDHDFAGDVSGFMQLTANSTVTGGAIAFGMLGYRNSGNNSTSNVCPSAQTNGSVYVFIEAAAFSDIESVVVNYPYTDGN
jgi:hypothetical protein